MKMSGVSVSPSLSAHPLALGLPSDSALIGFRLNRLRLDGMFLLGSRSPALRWKCLRGCADPAFQMAPTCLKPCHPWLRPGQEGGTLAPSVGLGGSPATAHHLIGPWVALGVHDFRALTTEDPGLV